MKSNLRQIIRSIFVTAVVSGSALTLVGCATGSGNGLVRGIPDWTADLSSTSASCTVAAQEAKRRALAAGISEDRLSWLYGKKPFAEQGHVSLVIDGWIVVDNGGLGRNAWGDSICPGNVCTVSEVQRGYDRSFIEPSTNTLQVAFHPQEWKVRAITNSRGNSKIAAESISIASTR